MVFEAADHLHAVVEARIFGHAVHALCGACLGVGRSVDPRGNPGLDDGPGTDKPNTGYHLGRYAPGVARIAGHAYVMDAARVLTCGAVDAGEKPAVLSAVVKANGFVFVSGQPPLDPETGELIKGDIRVQTEAVMRNLKLCLEAAGSGLDKVVKCNVYVTNIAYYDTVNEIYGRYFPNEPPARTFAAVASWPWEFDIEIECVALA